MTNAVRRNLPARASGSNRGQCREEKEAVVDLSELALAGVSSWKMMKCTAERRAPLRHPLDDVMGARLDSAASFQTLLDGTAPILALAPMQEVTDLPFW